MEKFAKMKLKTKILSIAVIILVFVILYLSRSSCAGGLVPCTNDCNLCYLLVGISNIFQWLMGSLLGITIILGVTISGITFIVSGAFPKALAFAKSSITSTMKGAFWALCGWLIINSVMNIVGYKHPYGGKWYQHECSTSGSNNNGNNGGKCDPKNKILQSVRIQCAAGSGEYISLDAASDSESKDEKDDKYQLTALGKYSCKKDDGTTEDSEEDITQKADWKASDETQIKVNKGLVQAIIKEATGTDSPYVEAAFENKKSNAMKVYIGSCPVTALKENQKSLKYVYIGNIIESVKAQGTENSADSIAPPNSADTSQQGWLDYIKSWYDYATTPKTTTPPGASTLTSKCKNACPTKPKNTCPFVAGNENAENKIIFIRADVSRFSTMPCTISKPMWKEGDQTQQKEFEQIVKEFAAGLDYTKSKANFGVYRSELVDREECPPGKKTKAYVVNGTAPPGVRAEAYGLPGIGSYYCFNRNGYQAFLFAHEHIGHGIAKLNDEYVEARQNPNNASGLSNYNCTAVSSCPKWSKTGEGCYSGCHYTNAFFRSTNDGIMKSRSSKTFGTLDDSIIDWTAKGNMQELSKLNETYPVIPFP